MRIRALLTGCLGFDPNPLILPALAADTATYIRRRAAVLEIVSAGPEGGRLTLVVRGWRLFGVPLPRSLAPGGNVHEEERDGRFHFDVEVKAPLIGLIVRYRGWLIHDGPGLAR